MSERFVEKSDFETFKFNIRKSIKAKQQKLQIETTVLSANLTLKIHNRRVQFLDPAGANRDIILPAEADSTDLFFFILNTGEEDLVIKEDSGVNTIITISQNEGGFVVCNERKDGKDENGKASEWRGFIGTKS